MAERRAGIRGRIIRDQGTHGSTAIALMHIIPVENNDVRLNINVST